VNIDSATESTGPVWSRSELRTWPREVTHSLCCPSIRRYCGGPGPAVFRSARCGLAISATLNPDPTEGRHSADVGVVISDPHAADGGRRSNRLRLRRWTLPLRSENASRCSLAPVRQRLGARCKTFVVTTSEGAQVAGTVVAGNPLPARSGPRTTTMSRPATFATGMAPVSGWTAAIGTPSSEATSVAAGCCDGA
jgi:hypothetical protein